jgi:hypothetical protein
MSIAVLESVRAYVNGGAFFRRIVRLPSRLAQEKLPYRLLIRKHLDAGQALPKVLRLEETTIRG